MTRAEEFQYEFNKLDKALRKLADADDRVELVSVIRELSRKNSVVRRFYNDLNTYRDLRNAIVHKSTEHAIAEPYQETIDGLRRIRESVEKPKTAWDIATTELITVSLEDSLSGVIRQMADMHITSLPIIDNKSVVGFISESTVVKIVDRSFEQGGALIDEAKIKDVDYDKPYGGDSDIYAYVTRKMTVYEIEDMFNDSIKNGKRLLAILVSDKGDASTTPLGIITAWDLHKIDR
jgi:predicted transcriptional regulator